MIRKLTSIALFLSVVFCMSAQMPQANQLPLNPKVKSGVLPNGLSYYIMHNEEPKERANFYIAQKVGSTLETPEQLGLAHFLEHMAFNGTTHYPGKTMLNYLQSKGIRFGEDINAYTAFDETVYNINNVPTTDKNLMDSVLLVLHDWSGDILLEESEIDAERGVIQEEWRQRSDAQNRMWMEILPKIYEEYQYEQMPIGKMEIVMNFKPEVLRAYYKKWYRPDQQGIVIVGDFDAAEMEEKVKTLFSTIPMPKNAAKREYPNVSDNKKPIYASFTDPELSMPRTTISFKSDKLPFEMRNTDMAYMSSFIENLVSQLINHRLEEFAMSPECDYAHAGVYFGDFFVSSTKDAFNIVVIPKNGTQKAVAEVMGIVARACKTGFTDSELARVREEILANYEKMYNERDKTDNDAFGNELCRHFIDNEPAPGIETEYEITKQLAVAFPVEVINQMVAQILTQENMVVVTSEPKKEGFEIVAEDVMIKTIQDAMNAQYEAYVDEVITDPLIATLPTPGKINKIDTNKEFDYTEFILSNGVKVIVKTTDFAGDEVNMIAFRNGGKQMYSADQAANLALISDAFESSKMGPFDVKTLKKYLAGKKADVAFSVGNYTDMLEGSSTVKDLPTLMELIYTAFTAVGADQAMYDVNIQQARTLMQNADQNPQKIFFDQVSKTQYPDNPLQWNATVATLDAASYPEMLSMIQSTLKNAAEYTFVFVGNVDPATIRPLLEQYIATLPVAMRKKTKPVTNFNIARGDIKNVFKQEMQTPSTFVYDVYSDTNIPYSVKNAVLVQLMGDCLSDIYTSTLREEEGGTYGASVGGVINPVDGVWRLIYFFQTNKDQQQTLIDRAQKELLDLLKNGASVELFNKSKEAMVKQYEINERTNSYWTSVLPLYLRGYNTITGMKEAINSVTLDELNAFMKGVYDGKNRIQVIMEGEAAN